MTDEVFDTESGASGSDPLPSVGSQLKAAREARQMSVSDIAMALKLGARQVEALENGDWQGLPGKTFIRGFVRNYARLLQVDAAPLMGQLDAVLESPQVRLALPEQKRQVTMPYSGRPRKRDYAMVWTGVGLVAIAAAVYVLWPADFSGLKEDVDSVVALFSSKEPAPPPAAAAPQPEPVFPPGTTPQQVMNPQAVAPAEAPAAPPPAPTLVPPPVLQEPSAPQAQKPLVPPPQPAPAAQPSEPQPVAADKAGALRLSFEQDSWVEVRDGHGKVLFSQIARAGSEQNVEGQGPFSLVIGNAPGVKLTLRGRPVELAAHTQGNVARLKLE